MKNIYKQLEGSVIPSNQSEFKKAVILLTAYYTIGIFIVLVIFNFLVYGLFTNSLQIKDSENGEKSSTQNDIIKNDDAGIKDMKDNLANILIISDIMILLLAVVVAYISSKRTLSPLEESYKRQTRFVANAAHELRTPLAVMKAGSEVILRSGRPVGEYEKFIKESLEEIERLTTLSNDLLFLAHDNKNRVKLASIVSFGDICKKQTEIMRVYANTKNIIIKDTIEENTKVIGIKDDLTRLVINLLKNAIDYNKNGGEVTLTLKKRKDKIVLNVEDNGIGINEDDISKIFERFYKIDNSRTRSSSGTGLGLSIVKEIVSEHGGSIEVHSEIDKGTIFSVTLTLI